jgi:hypothetical protein
VVKIFLALAFGTLAFGQYTSSDEETSVRIAGKSIRIEYSAPQMHGRKIFGKLVPWNQVWRPGANDPPMLYTEADLQIGRMKIKNGSYSLWLYVDTQWKLIVNEDLRRQGGLRDGYNQDRDVGRVAMKMRRSSEPIEQFKISLSEDGGDLVRLQMEWENTIASVPILVK